MTQFAFAIIFAITISSACVVAFSRNIIYSAFALLGTFLGVAGTFLLLSAEFVALTQVVVYAGGILVITLFAVMLTSKIENKKTSNPVFHWKIVAPVVGIFSLVLGNIIFSGHWLIVRVEDGAQISGMRDIGNVLLNKYLLPFELISVLLLVAMVAAALMTRRNLK